MAASDAILLTSGTASLEAMLVKRPTVVAYKMSPLTFAIAKRIIKVPYIALPNLLANQCIMPEFIQDQVNPEMMGKQILTYLNQPTKVNEVLPIFEDIHHKLRKNAGKQAAEQIAKLIT
jgi:lipid-A-disaccharide synthase